MYLAALNGAEKWSRDHHENWKFAYRHTKKFTDSKNAILFDLRRKITKLSRGKKPFQNSSIKRLVMLLFWNGFGITRRLWHFQHATVLERSIEVGFSLIVSIFVYISIKDLHAGYAPMRWRNLLSNLPKNADLDWLKLHYGTPLTTAKMPPITVVNTWPSWNDARRRYIILI